MIRCPATALFLSTASFLSYCCHVLPVLIRVMPFQSFVHRLVHRSNGSKKDTRPPNARHGANAGSASSTSPLPERLWNEAYDRLKEDEPKLVDAYERILSRDLDDASPEGSQTGKNEIAQADRIKRWEQMQRLLQAGLQKTEQESRAKQTIGNAMQGLLAVKDMIGSALQTMPQAALAWTGVCFAIEVRMSRAARAVLTGKGVCGPNCPG
jgi:hypothetical protein